MLKKIFSYGLILSALNVFAQSSSLRVNTDQMFLESDGKRNYIKNSGAEKNDSFVTDSSGIHTRSTSSPLMGAASHAIDATGSAQNVDFLAFDLDAVLAGRDCEAKFIVSGDASLYTATARINGADVSTVTTLPNTGSNSTPVSINFPCGSTVTAPVLRVSSTSASAAAIKIESVYFGEVTNLGMAQQIGDWVNYTSTVFGLGPSPTVVTKYRKIGDSIQVAFSGKVTSTASGLGAVTYTVPSLCVIDHSKIVPGFASASAFEIVGSFSYGNDGNAASSVGFAVVDGTSTTTIRGYADGSTSTTDVINTYRQYATSTTAGMPEDTTANASVYHSLITVPCVGWSSQQVISTNMPIGPTVQKFTSGTSTYTKPAGVQYIRVTVVGGGGGGGGSGSASWGDGGTGGTSTFGTSLLTATGGLGGSNPTLGTAGGVGGSATINSPAINILGLTGSEGEGQSPYNTSSVFTSAGNGGSSILGITGGSTPIPNSGAGGQGGASSGISVLRGRSGGGGGGIFAQINNPSNSYPVEVGAGGTPGAAGTDGNVGFAGSSGVVIVEEYYSTATPVLIGSVTSNSSGSERIERAQVAMAGGACSLTNQSGSWISSVTYNSLGKCTLNFVAGIWGSAPTCQATMNRDNQVWPTIATAASTSSIQIGMRTFGSPFFVDEPFTIMCMGPR